MRVVGTVMVWILEIEYAKVKFITLITTSAKLPISPPSVTHGLVDEDTF